MLLDIGESRSDSSETRQLCYANWKDKKKVREQRKDKGITSADYKRNRKLGRSRNIRVLKFSAFTLFVVHILRSIHTFQFCLIFNSISNRLHSYISVQYDIFFISPQHNLQEKLMQNFRILSIISKKQPQSQTISHTKKIRLNWN